MRDKLLEWEIKSLTLHQLELYIQKGKFTEQCIAEWENRMGRKYGEEKTG